MSEVCKKEKGKRGRKFIVLRQYDKLTQGARQLLLNQRSAQVSRLNKKREEMKLKEQIQVFERQFDVLKKILNTHLTSECRESVENDLLSKMKDTTALKEHSSPPIGGAIMLNGTRLRDAGALKHENGGAASQADQLGEVLQKFIESD